MHLHYQPKNIKLNESSTRKVEIRKTTKRSASTCSGEERLEPFGVWGMKKGRRKRTRLVGRPENVTVPGAVICSLRFPSGANAYFSFWSVGRIYPRCVYRCGLVVQVIKLKAAIQWWLQLGHSGHQQPVNNINTL
ncbi:hypothetical protein L2E82_15816 [Cichorium intybus]|uniref:Uncharacterized protein n=1 Tax=Cichorium intybus TaxID=13427 RepID=A0ACB9F358_CICIN|nr:hypothetical protein L2E82_15816 [Cichorium intybus]